MKRLLSVIWAIGVLIYPTHLALALIPEVADRVRTAELSYGLFSYMASDLWLAGNWLVSVLEVYAIGMSTLTPFWFAVSKRVRICWFVSVATLLVWFLIYGLRFRYHFGTWHFGIDAFEYWWFLLLATWPLMMLGYGYPELLRRLFLRLWRRGTAGAEAQQGSGQFQ